MKDHTKAYVAGLMDAEGCFSIYKATPRSGERTPYQPRIVLSSVDLPVVKWLVKTFGGFYTKHLPKKGRVWYQWNLNGTKSAMGFLSDTLPYLKIKKEEALVLQEFYSLGSVQNPETRQALMEKIRRMKNRECVTTDTLDGEISGNKIHAYLAGIVDGEGCVSAAYTPTGKSMVRIRVGNTFFPLISFLQATYGGWYHTQKSSGNTKEFYTWEISKKEEKERFLLSTLPYLKIKRQQAKAALLYVRLPATATRLDRRVLCEGIRNLNSPKIQSELGGNPKSIPAGTQAI